jgi:GH15 family glucan-1,4-alpha-glucosidase
VRLEEGQSRDLVLVLSACDDAGAAAEADEAWRRTEQSWHDRVPELDLEVGARDARHAVAVLTGLTTSGGGMVAAATLGLPERAYRNRSFDYRYVWLRDQVYAGRAAARAGIEPLVDAAVRFTRERLLEHGPQVAPAYTVTGGPVPEERETGLPGYPGGAGVAGNHAGAQFQLDVFGEALLLFAEAAAVGRAEAEDWRAAEVAAEAIEQRWLEPDCGIWELDPHAWTQSRLLAVAGLRKLVSARPQAPRAERWTALADAILSDTTDTSLHPAGHWQRAPDDDRVDAALLVPALRGALPPDDPRSIATLDAVLEQLTQDGYAYRYAVDPGAPLGEAEGAFILCGFLVSLSLLQRGDVVHAVRWFERNRAACGPPGLLAEEYDVRQRQLRGNLPQAFVHALLLECAVEQQRVLGG